MLLGKRIPLEIAPGVNPSTDSTALDTIFWTNSDKIRFSLGKLRKMLGWIRIWSSNFQEMTGTCRNIFSYRDQNNNPITLFGTSTRLYAYAPNQGGEIFYNITPLSTTTTVIANAFSTEYNAGVIVPVITTEGNPDIILVMTQYFETGDLISISGVTGTVNGIPGSEFNGTFTVFAINNAQVQITLPSNATSSGTDSVTMTWASNYLYVNYPDNGLSEYDRVKFLLATSVDGISSTVINSEYMISAIVDANTFVISTSTVATSAVTAGGGTATTIQTQISAGESDEISGNGFGFGQYGIGQFGANLPNPASSNILPRIWSMDTFGTNVVLTPGDTPGNDPTIQNLYEWNNNLEVAPLLISTAPPAVKWVYVSNNIVCTLGAQGILNQFYGSDAGNYNNWTPGAATLANIQVFQQANTFLTQSKARNFDLLFTSSSVYTMEFIGLPNIWLPRKLFSTDGIIGAKARGIVEDAVFWMGQGDFYVFDGYTVNVLPGNTVKRYVYDNLNWEEADKCFVHVDVEWSTCRFYYCAGQDTECNNYVDYNYKEFHWTLGTNARSASEEPINITDFPILVQSGGTDFIASPNSITTFFFTLAANPLTTSMGSDTVVISIDFGDVYFQLGDMIFIRGAVDTNGIPAGDINGVQTIASVTYEVGFGSGIFGFGEFGTDALGVSSFTFNAATPATSSGTGGGSSITVGTQILAITYTGNSLQVDQPITIAGAGSVDGFSAGDINGSTTIRYIQNGYIEVDVPTSGVYSTSQVVDGGGALTSINTMLECRVFQHNTGLNDYNPNFNRFNDPWDQQFLPMNSFAQTNYFQIGEGDNTMLIYSLYPDIIMAENMVVQVNVKEFAQGEQYPAQFFNMDSNTRKIDPMMIGRVRQYVFSSDVLNGNYLMGKLFEEIKESTPR